MEALVVSTKGWLAVLGKAYQPSVPCTAAGSSMAFQDFAILGGVRGLVGNRHCEQEGILTLLKP